MDNRVPRPPSGPAGVGAPMRSSIERELLSIIAILVEERGGGLVIDAAQLTVVDISRLKMEQQQDPFMLYITLKDS